MFNILRKKKFIYLFVILLIFFSGCSKNKNKIKKPEKIPSIEILYRSAFNFYEDGSWKDSILLFQKVETRYSFTEWAPRATLMIMYMYYESGESIKTLEYVKKFKKLYPRNKNVDYVDFIKALTFYENVNVVSRDQTYTKLALTEFKNIITKYPNSIYAEESKLKIDLLTNN